MSAPFFLSYKYSNSGFGQNNGAIFDIYLSGGTPPYTVNWVGLSGYSSGPFVGSPSTNLSGLTAGSYTGTVIDSLFSSATTSITIVERPELVLSAHCTNSSCISGNSPTCKIQVDSFAHAPGCFRYDLYTGATIVQSYTGCSGDEVYEFSGLTKGLYVIKATETSQFFYEYTEISGCTTQDIQIGSSTNPDSIVSAWTRFCFFADATGAASFPSTSNRSGLLSDGTIMSGNPAVYFYTGLTNPTVSTYPTITAGPPYYLGEFNLAMTEGEDVGPIPLTFPVRNWFYYNSYINKFVMEYNTSGAATLRWATFDPRVDVGNLGNPTASQSLTTSANWSTAALTSEQFTVSGANNTVVLASSKILAASGTSKMVVCSQNSGLLNGFYSPCEYLTYSHEVSFGSTNGDDDNINIVLAAFKDDNGKFGSSGITHTLQLSYNLAGSNMSVIYNQSQSAYAFTSGTTSANTVYSGLMIRRTGVNTPFGSGGNYNTKGNVRTKVVRSGSNGEQFDIYMTKTMGNTASTQSQASVNVGGSNPYYSAFTISFSLTDPTTWTQAPSYANVEDLSKFLGSQRFGYGTLSQSSTQFFDVNFSGIQTSVIPTSQQLVSGAYTTLGIVSSTFSGNCDPCVTVGNADFIEEDIEVTTIDATNDDGSSLDGCFVVTSTIIPDPNPTLELNDCGCNSDDLDCDTSISVCVDKTEVPSNARQTYNCNENIISITDNTEYGLYVFDFKQYKPDGSVFSNDSGPIPRTSGYIRQECCTSFGGTPVLYNTMDGNEIVNTGYICCDSSNKCGCTVACKWKLINRSLTEQYVIGSDYYLKFITETGQQRVVSVDGCNCLDGYTISQQITDPYTGEQGFGCKLTELGKNDLNNVPNESIIENSYTYRNDGSIPCGGMWSAPPAPPTPPTYVCLNNGPTGTHVNGTIVYLDGTGSVGEACCKYWNLNNIQSVYWNETTHKCMPT